ncbi:hypothetical protein AMK09_04855 [Streptomyces sp. CB02488]|uniref:DUF4232 domain-containing protein n=1 Tax=Streptomyces sp. CB02488 TaxID=1703920 RepID=UPI00093BAC19|nr:DUF4232 domain-containing protein [Streptomyces sp. CB02488]OKK24194.1 hypothetical protein AMK09_04855 [Streptomyces sp. CB02488]
MSAFRTRSRATALAATTTAVLALALTACGGSDSGTGTRSEGPANNAAPASAAKSATGSGSGSAAKTSVAAKGTAGGTTTGGSGNGGTGTGSSTGGAAKGATGSASAPLCTTEDVRISAAAQDGPPYTHIVLTAKNTSGHRCEMKGFPEIQFLESHKQNIPSVAKSKPATRIVLDAGAPAYALVKLSNGGADEDVQPVTAFAVWLQGGSGQAAVRAPGAEGIAVDPAAYRTGYWTYELRNGADDF